MKKILNRALGACLAIGVGLGVGVGSALADTPGESPHQRFELGDFRLENGQVIEKGFLTYVTHGSLNEERNNAVLVLPALMGTHHRHDFMIGPGKALDPKKYFIIAADTLGNGRAISPSNSETQPGMKFPQFSIRDMVNAQHKLVTEGLELDRLLAVVGLSMGGMQTYQWGVSYPDENGRHHPYRLAGADNAVGDCDLGKPASGDHG
jgi:homoserine O-acetyltransferase